MARLHLLPWYHLLTNQRFTNLDRTISRSLVILCSSRAGIINSYCIKQNNCYTIPGMKTSQQYTTTTHVDDKNIFKSVVPDIANYHGLYLHDIVWMNADKWWNKTAMVCAKTGRSYTYNQLKKLSGKFATSLRKNNLRPGDTIATILPNIPEYAIILLGASEAGVKITLINPIYTAEEIKKQLSNSETVAALTVPTKYPIVAESIRGNFTIRLPVIVIEDGIGSVPSGAINFKDLVTDDIEEFEKTGQKTERDPELDTFMLPYSSGTTGLPKGVELTHRNLVANIYQVRASELKLIRDTTTDYQDVLPLFLPLYHIYGLMYCLCNYLCEGIKMICMPQFSSTELLNVLDENSITIFKVAPPIIQLLINDDRFTSRHMASVHCVFSGAAPLGEEVIDKFFTRYGTHFSFNQGYGLTETSPVISTGKNTPTSSVGKIVPNTDVRIVKCEGDNVEINLGHNEVGEIYIRGPQVMKGYFKNPQATQNCMEDEWFKTGDLGFIDDNGYLHIRGRLKELIKVKGYQVAPAELEDILQGHKKVADVAVIGTPHDKYGEIPIAFIVPKPNMRINEQEIKDFVAQRVAHYKQLGYVSIIDKIPRSAAGKILRKELQKI